jgi:hypothetical protein
MRLVDLDLLVRPTREEYCRSGPHGEEVITPALTNHGVLMSTPVETAIDVQCSTTTQEGNT